MTADERLHLLESDVRPRFVFERRSVGWRLLAGVQLPASVRYLPQDQSQGVHIDLLQGRLALAQVHRSFQDLRRHVPQSAHLVQS